LTDFHFLQCRQNYCKITSKLRPTLWADNDGSCVAGFSVIDGSSQLLTDQDGWIGSGGQCVYLEFEELRECDDGCGQTDDYDDDASAARRAPDLTAHRMTNSDIAFDGERHRQPDAGVAARVAEPHGVQPVADVPGARRHGGVVMQDDGEDQRQVEHVVDGQRRQVVVRGRLHGAARQHGDVDRVRDDAEHDHDRHQNALDDEPRRRQFRRQRQRAIRFTSVQHYRRRQTSARRDLDRHRLECFSNWVLTSFTGT